MRETLPWIPQITADGSFTLRSGTVGEACHSRSGAWREARERYARATRIAERAKSGELRVCRVLDVGAGLGLNVAAALEALAGTDVPLDVVSLESERSVIEAAVELADSAGGSCAGLGRHWRPVILAFRRALASQRDAREGVPLGDRGRLRLLLGDGRTTLPVFERAARFDAVFLDPFSPAADPLLWELSFLKEVAARMAPGSLLSTYTASLTVRARLSAAGLIVGSGGRVGAKSQGTLASPDQELAPLPARVARKLAARIGRMQGAAPGEGAPPCSS